MTKKRKSKLQRPDETFSSGPLTVSRFGRITVLQSNWQEKHIEEFQMDLVERYPEIILEINTLVTEIADLIAKLPPDKLLQRAWFEMATLHIKLESELEAGKEELLSMRMIDYVQSVIAAVPPSHNQHQEVTEKEWRTLREKIDELFDKINEPYQFSRRAKNQAEDSDFNKHLDEFQYKAQMYWCNIKGNRYQVHEPAYLQNMFVPYTDVLEELFGISGKQFADEITKIWHTLTFGLSETFHSMNEFRAETLHALEKKIASEPDAQEHDLPELMDEVIKENDWEDRRDDIFGRFFGMDLFDVQKSTSLPEKLLKELAWSPGEDAEFFAEGEFRGWPLRIWPLFKRPFIRLNNRYYCFDLYSLLDNIYRVIDRLVNRLKPDYRETWNSIQKSLSENLPIEFFERLLPGATIFKQVYYRGQSEAGTSGWCEADALLIYDDHLFVIEAKGGAFTYTPPATDIQAWLKSLDNLVLKPATQGKRFVKYLSSSAKVPFYDKKHNKIGELSRSDFRHVTICAVTIDPFTEIAAKVQHLHDIGLDVGSEPVWSISVDDLQIYADVFENPLLFLHYVEQRMCAFQSTTVQCEDEIEHLGLYLQHNHYSTHVKEIQDKPETYIQLIGYREDIDKFFSERLQDPDAPCPLKQQTPTRILEIVQFLSNSTMAGRAEIAGYLLDLSSDWRENISNHIDDELAKQPITKRATPFSTHGSEVSLTVYCWRAGSVRRTAIDALENARAILLINNDTQRLFLELIFRENCILKDVRWHWVELSNIPSEDLPRLRVRAERLRRDRVTKAKLKKRKIGRNEQCPCGSGKKYKFCCIG